MCARRARGLQTAWITYCASLRVRGPMGHWHAGATDAAKSHAAYVCARADAMCVYYVCRKHCHMEVTVSDVLVTTVS